MSITIIVRALRNKSDKNIDFRQGLVIDPKTGNVIESCGRYGSSYITIYSTDKKKVYLRKSLPKYVFGTNV